MPTAAKLAAALAFAALGFLSGQLFGAELPKGTATTIFGPVAAAIGLVCGWRISGALAGKGYGQAVGTGIRTAVTTVFWGLLGYAIQTMVIRSMRKVYQGPMDAVLGMFDLLAGYVRLAAAPELLAALFFGGLAGGVLTEWVGRRWP